MKAIILALAALLATPAVAQDFTGPRAEVRVGAEHLNLDVSRNHLDANGVAYGGAVGYDVQLAPHLIAGLEATAQASSADGSIRNALRADSKHEFALGGRLGVTHGNVMAYGKLAYANDRLAINARDLTKEGLRYGGGLEVLTTRHTYAKVEYLTTTYDAQTASHQGLVAFGVRF